ncbi:RHS repeat-associated core domain-containing protein [Microbulbifer variabilis]|uniref:RHS repeat-associated core domain-containing protein n=1 Tax=Microbulbifer variabilis TaxID=266805 RepID=UPI00036557A7|nr:RHS repeat-associated core domain-containing protein [Microbulbifer variabilis]
MVSTATGPFTVKWTVSESGLDGWRVNKVSGPSGSFFSRSGKTAGSYSETFYPTEDGVYTFELTVDRICCAGKDIASYTLDAHSVSVRLAKPGKPAAPTSVTNSQTGAFTVSWSSPSGAASQRYELVHQLNDGSWSSPISVSGRSYSVSGLSTGEWDFKVRACNSAGCGSYSNEKRVNVAIPPSTPSAISVYGGEEERQQIVLPLLEPIPMVLIIPPNNSESEGAVTVKWSEADSGERATGYEIEQCKDNCSAESDWTRVYSAVGVGPISLPLEGGTPLASGTYQYRIRAYVTVGSYTTYSDWITSSSVTVVRKPDTVLNFTQPSHGTQSESFTVAWSSVSGAFNPVTRYELKCSINNGGYTYSNCGSSNLGTSTSMQVTLNQGDSGVYRFIARACNSDGCSGWTPSANTKVVMVNVPLEAPNAPKFISTPEDSEFGDYDISWSEPDLTWTSFELQRERRNDPDPICGDSCWKVVSGNLAGTTYEARGDLEDKYRYRVRACNGPECSDWATSDWIDVHNLEGIEPAVSLALADTPGTMQYSAEVSSQGDAVISIPIEVAPGVNNLVPNLGIRYSGARYRERNNEMLPEDILGYGWRLSGLQEIRRCVKNRPNTDRIMLDDTDSLCLNGQPLVLVSGSYWEPGSTYRKLKDDFSLVELKETDEQPWFLVHKPNGEVREFGNTEDSQVRAGQNPSFAWSISKTTDVFGNSIAYRYHLDTVEGINYPLEITYGNEGDARIEFAYGTRSDAPPQPLSPGEIEQEQLVLLHHINVYLDSQLLREYRLITEPEPEPTGEDTEHYRRLQQVQQCGYDEHGTSYKCLNPLVFGWDEVDSNSELDLDIGVSKIIDGLGKATKFYHTTVRDVAVKSSEGGDGIFLERPFGEGVLPANTENLEADNGDYRTVVGEVHKSNGMANGWHVTKYYYQGVGLVSTQNWGFLGFYAQKIHDEESGIVTYLQFRQDFPHFGKVARKLQFQGAYGSHTQQLADQRYQYTALELSTGLDKSYYPFLEKSAEALFERDQIVGYRSIENSVEKNTFGAFGELLESQTTLEVTAKSLTESSGQASWGEIASFSLNGIDRSREIFTSFENRVSNDQWLVGFVAAQELSEYDGDTTGTPDRTETVISLPYQSTNRVATRVRFPDDTELRLSTDFNYDESGNLVSETTSGSNIETRTTFATDFVDRRYPATLTNALNQSLTLSYDHRFGAVSKIIVDSDGLTTSTQYDEFGRELNKTNTDDIAFTTKYTQCFAGTCPVSGGILAAYKVTKDSSITPQVDLYYDLLGRLVQQDQEAFDGQRIAHREFNYDLQGRLYLETEPYYPGESKPLTIYDYDIKDRISKVVRPDGSEIRTNYYPDLAQRYIRIEAEEDILDSNGSLLVTQIKHHFYNISGSQVKVVEAVGTDKEVATEYDYYGSGLLKSVLVNSDSTTRSTFFYDNAGNNVQTVDPAFGTVTTHYTALGQVREQTNNKGQTLSYLYDKLGRMLEQVDANGVSTWTYDAPNATGNIASRSYSQNGLTLFAEGYVYNAAGKLEELNTDLQAGGLQRSYQHKYSYDHSGRLEKLTYPSGAQAHHFYTSQGFLSEITDGQNALKTFKDRDASGKLLEFAFGNDLTTSRSYDAKSGLLTSINTGGGSIQNNIYKWRSNGTLESRTSVSGSNTKVEHFFYDALNRLESAETLLGGSHQRTLSTLYDSLGNIVSKSATGAANNQVTGYQYEQSNNAGPNAVTQATINDVVNYLNYDENGSVTHYDAAVGDDKWITWNARHQAEEITVGSAQNTATPVARDRFQYGPNGQRYYRESSWWDESQQKLMTEKAFIVGDYEDLLPANDPDYQQIEKVRIGGDVLQVTATDHLGIKVEVFEFLHRDHLGSIEKVTDEAGAVILDTAFDPYGSRKKGDWSGVLSKAEIEELVNSQGLTTKRGFTGHEHLDRTGLIHMNGRIYDPTLGRFLSPDPFVQFPSSSQSWNRYSYVRNNPLSVFDPSGYLERNKKKSLVSSERPVEDGPTVIGDPLPSGALGGGKIYSVGTGGFPGSGGILRDTGGGGSQNSEEEEEEEEDKPEEVNKTASCEDYKRAGMSCGGQKKPGYFDKSLTMIRSSLNWREVKRQFWRTIEAFPGAGTVSGTAKLGAVLAVAKVAPKTSFKTSHYAPRLEAAGLNVAHVESIIAKQVASMTAHLTPKAPFAGRTTIDGVLVEYRAMTLPNGSVNVGTIFPVK